MTLTISDLYIKKVSSRLAKLPKYIGDIVKTKRKSDANIIIKSFQDAIKYNNIGLEPLAEKTVDKKSSEGMSKPSNPLYGKGKDEKRRDRKSVV
jgi:hypothetical protein